MMMQAAGLENKRVFLFLQGPSSPLFQLIADRLERLGHRAIRINICAGDRVFWRRPGAINFSGALADWHAFVLAIIAEHGVSEIILLGEERPYHRIAAVAAKGAHIPVYAIEMGYLRPDWISIEIDGAGSNSHFPASSKAILAAASGLSVPDLTPIYSHSFAKEVALDLAYNLPNVFLRFLHPHYRWHAVRHPLAEYAGWIGRFLAAPRRRRETDAVIAALAREKSRYFLFPLQLQTDLQIRVHSPFERQEQAIELVLRSFAGNAAPDVRLVFKTHPLDNGLIDWKAAVGRIASKHGIEGRVHVIFGGNLRDLAVGSMGLVTINSTAALQALLMSKPVTALGTAIFDIDRLTDQRPLEAFFADPLAPDDKVRNAFFALIAHALHERGNFYSATGARDAANALALRIHERRVNQPDAYVEDPPRRRLAKIAES